MGLSGSTLAPTAATTNLKSSIHHGTCPPNLRVGDMPHWLTTSGPDAINPRGQPTRRSSGLDLGLPAGSFTNIQIITRAGGSGPTRYYLGICRSEDGGTGSHGSRRVLIKATGFGPHATTRLRNARYALEDQRISRELAHPFIAEFVASLVHNSVAYVVTVCGGQSTLRNLQMDQPNHILDLGATRFYFMEAFLAVEHLHDNFIVHRDVRPEALVVGDDGHIRLTDLGCAKRVLHDRPVCTTMIGTLHCMAPEVLNLEPYGFPVDFWGLGCLLFDLLHGHSPFLHKREAKTLSHIRLAEFQWTARGTGYAKSLAHKLLHLLPQARPTATQFRAHLFFDSVEWGAVLDHRVPKPRLSVGADSDLSPNLLQRLARTRSGRTASTSKVSGEMLCLAPLEERSLSLPKLGEGPPPPRLQERTSEECAAWHTFQCFLALVSQSCTQPSTWQPILAETFTWCSPQLPHHAYTRRKRSRMSIRHRERAGMKIVGRAAFVNDMVTTRYLLSKAPSVTTALALVRGADSDEDVDSICPLTGEFALDVVHQSAIFGDDGSIVCQGRVRSRSFRGAIEAMVLVEFEWEEERRKLRRVEILADGSALLNYYRQACVAMHSQMYSHWRPSTQELQLWDLRVAASEYLSNFRVRVVSVIHERPLLKGGAFSRLWRAQSFAFNTPGARPATLRTLGMGTPAHEHLTRAVTHSNLLLDTVKHQLVAQLVQAFHRGPFMCQVLDCDTVCSLHDLIHGTPLRPEGSHDRVSWGAELLQKLAQLWSDEYLSMGALRHVTVELVVAVEAVHQCNIVLNDLTSHDVLIARDGHISLTIPTLARHSNHNAASVRMDVAVLAQEMSEGPAHTTCSLPPELCEAAPSTPLKQGSYPGDWWSVGSILFEGIAKAPPAVRSVAEKECEAAALVPASAEHYHTSAQRGSEHCALYVHAKRLIGSLLRHSPEDRPSAAGIRASAFLAGCDVNAHADRRSEASLWSVCPDGQQDPEAWMSISMPIEGKASAAARHSHVIHEVVRMLNEACSAEGEWRAAVEMDCLVQVPVIAKASEPGTLPVPRLTTLYGAHALADLGLGSNIENGTKSDPQLVVCPLSLSNLRLEGCNGAATVTFDRPCSWNGDDADRGKCVLGAALSFSTAGRLTRMELFGETLDHELSGRRSGSLRRSLGNREVGQQQQPHSSSYPSPSLSLQERQSQSHS